MTNSEGWDLHDLIDRSWPSRTDGDDAGAVVITTRSVDNIVDHKRTGPIETEFEIAAAVTIRVHVDHRTRISRCTRVGNDQTPLLNIGRAIISIVAVQDQDTTLAFLEVHRRNPGLADDSIDSQHASSGLEAIVESDVQILVDSARRSIDEGDVVDCHIREESANRVD